MWLDADICYRAVAARDWRFDGRFFVAVKSTGIYCRPICRVRTPQRKNCEFYASAAAAEAQGFRPCLRCRPELAPGHASMDASGRLAHAAARLGALSDQGVDGLAGRLGISDRHLRRVFTAEFGVAPIAYAQTQRLLLAKRLLTDTRLPITRVALASGFASVRRFNAMFRQRYRLQPRDLRKRPAALAAATGQLVFELAYRPPYDWSRQLAFLGARCIAGVEVVREDSYVRTAVIENGSTSHRGWISVKHRSGRNTLEVIVSDSLASVGPQVLGRVKHLFDLACRPDEISHHLGDLAVSSPGLRVPGAFDGFEIAVRAVLGQQITVQAARTLAGRVAGKLGEPIATPYPELICTFPTPGRLAEADGDCLGRLGITRSRQKSLHALASMCGSGAIVLAPGVDIENTVQKLLELPGIGPWTAQYVAMRALAWPDAFPHTDFGITKAIGQTAPRQVLKIAEPWRPWRAYAAVHLWNSLSEKVA